ncbi:MAG TPA: helix-turn-helix domain-containing protein [Acidimicrobiales bacterium]|nr:helix-turn-helix domain-containing protein [Acidimicrobiales bacterium]
MDVIEKSPMEAADGAIWKALASPHRRALLDLLRDGPRTTGDLAAATPGLSRFAVMQHLGVLEVASLVLVRRRGRERFNHLDAVPIHQAYERWVTKLAGTQAGRLTALDRHLTKEPTMSNDTGRAVHLESELRFNAPPERVFEALTKESLDWYPHTYGGDRVRAIVVEPRVGGAYYEDWGDGAGKWYGTVTWWDPPRRFTYLGHLGLGTSLEQSYVFEADGDDTVLKQSLVAFGPISAEAANGISFHGDLKRYEEPLRAHIERAG